MDHDDPGRRRQLIAAVVVLALLVAAGLWLNLDSDGEGVAAGALTLHAFLPGPA